MQKFNYVPAGPPPDKVWTPDEVQIILMSLATMIEDFQESIDSNLFKKEAKQNIIDMLKCARSAKKKLESATMGGKEVVMPPFEEGDEKEFLK